MATERKGRSRPSSRRSVLRTLGIGVVASGVFAGTVAGGGGTFARQLDTVRSSTRKYRDVAVARSDGYTFFGAASDVGHIFANLDFIGNTGLTESPSLLFYAPNSGAGPTDDSDLILAGIEYHVAGDQTDDPPDLFDDESASRELKVTEAEGWHRSPIPDVLDVTGLHVWVHLGNPEGVFQIGHPIMERLVDE